MASGVRIKESNPGFIKKLLDKYKNGVEIAVGLPAKSESAGLRYPDGTPLLDVAYRNEFGVGVPARPFMRAGVRSNLREINKIASEAVVEVNAGNLELGDAAEIVGQVAAAGVGEYIVELSSPPNSPATIEAKGSSSPLVDTGLLWNSITHEVRRRK